MERGSDLFDQNAPRGGRLRAERHAPSTGYGGGSGRGPRDDDGEYEYIRPEASTGRKVMTVVAVLFVGIALVVAASGLWVSRQLNPGGAPGSDVEVTVPEGSSTAAIADLLEDDGVIPNATVFRQYVRVKGAGPFQAGQFVFRENSAVWDAVSVLDAGPEAPPFREVTVPEGLTLPEITEKVAADIPGFSLDRLNEVVGSGQVRSRYQPDDVANLEGFLFPETYRVEEGQDEAALLTQMVAQLDAVGDEVGLAESEERVGLSPYEVLIVASLVQEEARIPEDGPMIARVIYNRLEEDMALGIDATICYQVGERPCSLTRSDLEEDSPYNSRLNTGLPPTPIAAPGRSAIEAALNPAEGPWTYYVLDPNAATPGGHFFTDDPAEFARVKEECENAGLGCG
ncbi:endolytic transglycosylase MltG [soil metagenome]